MKALRIKQARIYGGVWGSGLFQSIYEPTPGILSTIPLMPEWYLLLIALGITALCGMFWPPLLLAIPLLVIATGILIGQAYNSAKSSVSSASNSWTALNRKHLHLITLLHVIQPLARLKGRIWNGLIPFRRNQTSEIAFPGKTQWILWSESWNEPAQYLESIERYLTTKHVNVRRGGDFDLWDFEVGPGPAGLIRIRTVVEEHGSGKQLLRINASPNWSFPRVWWIPLVAGLTWLISAGTIQSFVVLAGLLLMALIQNIRGQARAMGAVHSAVRQLQSRLTGTSNVRVGHHSMTIWSQLLTRFRSLLGNRIGSTNQNNTDSMTSAVS